MQRPFTLRTTINKLIVALPLSEVDSELGTGELPVQTGQWLERMEWLSGRKVEPVKS